MLHNPLDVACNTLGDEPHRTVPGARCWACRPHQTGEFGPPRHADDSPETLRADESVKTMGVRPAMPAEAVEGWEAFLDEHGTVDTAHLERIGRELLVAIGEDPDREGIRDTPARWARWWAEFIDYQPGTIGTVFQSVGPEQLVVVRGVTVWSLCEHHLIPFKTTLTMGYLTGASVVGLSKLARIAHMYAHRLQLQERLVAQIGARLSDVAGTENVGVIGVGSHLCMEMRGIRTPGEMVTSHLTGKFLERDLRAEFLALHHG
jgi:GTP cyclohydrolase I